MKSFTDMYADAKDVVLGYLGNTKSSRRDYVQRFYSQPETYTEKGCFERGLGMACAFRAAKMYRDDRYMESAVSKLESLESELSDDGSLSIATKMWANTEAYQATGDYDYVREAKRHADVLTGERMELGRFVKSDRTGWESDAEAQLMSASALLQLYDLSKVESYRRKAEDILDFFSEKHLVRLAVPHIVEKLNVSVGDSRIDYEPDSGCGRQDYLRELAAITYANAYRVAGKYRNEAAFLFESSKSFLMYSEAGKAFKSKTYSRGYRDMLKSELSARPSIRNLAGVMNRPVFGVDTEDGSVFRDMLGVNFAMALGTALVWTTVASFGVPVYAFSTAAICATGALISPYVGKMADKIGKKTVLVLGLGSYVASTLLMPLSINLFGDAGLLLLQTVRGASGIAAGPMISSLVTDVVPAGMKTEALSESTAAYNVGYVGGSLLGGVINGYAKASSEIGKFVPFLIAAFPPAIMTAKLLANSRRNKLRRQMLDSIFNGNDTMQDSGTDTN